MQLFFFSCILEICAASDGSGREKELSVAFTQGIHHPPSNCYLQDQLFWLDTFLIIQLAIILEVPS